MPRACDQVGEALILRAGTLLCNDHFVRIGQIKARPDQALRDWKETEDDKTKSAVNRTADAKTWQIEATVAHSLFLASQSTFGHRLFGHKHRSLGSDDLCGGVTSRPTLPIRISKTAIA